MAMTMRDRIELAMRRNIKVDVTGLAPAVASTLLVGFEEAGVAVLAELENPTEGMIAALWEHTADPCWEENAREGFIAAIRAAQEGK